MNETAPIQSFDPQDAAYQLARLRSMQNRFYELGFADEPGAVSMYVIKNNFIPSASPRERARVNRWAASCRETGKE
jgi:hypothetical protein